MSTVVTPGLFSQADVTVSKRTSYLLAFFALLVFFAFGIFGKSESVAFQWSKEGDAIHIPDFVVGSNVVGIVVGALLAAAEEVRHVRVLLGLGDVQLQADRKSVV